MMTDMDVCDDRCDPFEPTWTVIYVLVSGHHDGSSGHGYFIVAHTSVHQFPTHYFFIIQVFIEMKYK